MSESNIGTQETIAAYEFGEYVLDVDRATLRRGEQRVHLRPQTYEVLKFLLRTRGRLVSKNEIIESVWRGAAVGDDSVTQCIREIRKALEDRKLDLIRTVPRRGYIFSLSVRERPRSAQAGSTSPATEDGTAPADGLHAAPETSSTVPELQQVPLDKFDRRGALKKSILLLMVILVGGFGLERLLQQTVPDRAERQSEVGDGESAWVPASYSKSIAVLPFADLSQGSDNQFLADGIALELLNLLARLPELRVVSRSSSFSYRGDEVDMRILGNDLDVAYVLDGTVRTEGDDLRVTAYLVETATNTTIWSERYEGKLAGIFDIQDAVAAAIVDKLKIHLVHPQPRTRRTSPEAYELYMRANHIVRVRLGQSEFRQAYELTQDVLVLDPTYVPALILQSLILYWSAPDDLGFPITEESIGEPLLRALEIAPYDGVANGYMAWQDMAYRGDAEGAAERANIALATEPQNAEVLRIVGATLYMLGRLDDSIELIRRSINRDPQCGICDITILNSYISSGRFAEAEYHLRRRMDREDIAWHFAYINLLLAAGRDDEARASIDAASTPESHEWFEGVRAILWCQIGDTESFQNSIANAVDLAERFPANPVNFSIIEAYACAGKNDKAFEWIERGRAVVAASSMAPYRLWAAMVQDPLLEPLHEDPRWSVFRTSVGLGESRLAAITVNIPPENAGAAAIPDDR